MSRYDPRPNENNRRSAASMSTSADLRAAGAFALAAYATSDWARTGSKAGWRGETPPGGRSGWNGTSLNTHGIESLYATYEPEAILRTPTGRERGTRNPLRGVDRGARRQSSAGSTLQQIESSGFQAWHLGRDDGACEDRGLVVFAVGTNGNCVRGGEIFDSRGTVGSGCGGLASDLLGAMIEPGIILTGKSTCSRG